jgi:hypothetical protein
MAWRGASSSYGLQHSTGATHYRRCFEASDAKVQFQRDDREHTLCDWNFRSMTCERQALGIFIKPLPQAG